MMKTEEKILAVIHRVHELFKEKGVTLSVAESCTGGLICHYITTLPGASSFFRAGIIAYSAEAKKKILGVSSEAISKYGVVSVEIAKELSEKLRGLADTDFSLSTTGNLGPDVLERKERGLIYIAVSRKGKSFTKELRLKGNREENKDEASLLALRFLIEVIEGND